MDRRFGGGEQAWSDTNVGMMMVVGVFEVFLSFSFFVAEAVSSCFPSLRAQREG